MSEVEVTGKTLGKMLDSCKSGYKLKTGETKLSKIAPYYYNNNTHSANSLPEKLEWV